VHNVVRKNQNISSVYTQEMTITSGGSSGRLGAVRVGVATILRCA